MLLAADVTAGSANGVIRFYYILLMVKTSAGVCVSILKGDGNVGIGTNVRNGSKTSC